MYSYISEPDLTVKPLGSDKTALRQILQRQEQKITYLSGFYLSGLFAEEMEYWLTTPWPGSGIIES